MKGKDVKENLISKGTHFLNYSSSTSKRTKYELTASTSQKKRKENFDGKKSGLESQS
jgi:hypothetical protein